MRVFNISVPDKPLINIELVRYARLLKIPDFRGVFMRDTLPQYPLNVECGIVNFNTSNQPGSHWVCYYRNKNERIYFDSYGQITPVEIQRYLKTGSESWKGSYTEKYRHRTSCEYISVWSSLPVRVHWRTVKSFNQF